MSSKLECVIWSRDTGQQIPCFTRCQLTITWVSNIKEGHNKTKAACVCQPFSWSMVASLCDSAVTSTTIMHMCP